MKELKHLLSAYFLFILLQVNHESTGQVPGSHITKLNNPISASYLKKNLSSKSPKLFLTPAIEKNLKNKLKTDPVMKEYYQYLLQEAERIITEPLLKRELEGFRLLFVSREMLERMTILCMVYRVDKDPNVLKRIDQEINAVCDFEDWNPQHFLDIAEMSLAVALAVDWTGAWLPKETVLHAKSSLIEKGIKPSFNEGGTRMFWINSTNNWNAVCHGGMIAASLVIANMDVDLAAKTISRALDKLPNSLQEYAPDGIYPEGPTYWGYGTSYSVVASNILTSSLGTDFGISSSPGFLKSVHFLAQATAPSGYFFNFADSGDKIGGRQTLLKLWFAVQTGDGLYFDKSFFENPQNAGRFAGLGLVWLSQYEQGKDSELELSWHGKGANPVAVFRGEKEDPGQFYLGVKGGKAHLSHGNMDAGTFVFDLDGVRWVVDPGNQRYYLLNKIGFNLSGHCQECPRWTLMTKRNQGHSTITVNDARFDVEAHAPIINFSDTDQPEVTIDLSDLYFDNVNAINRKFIKENSRSILIQDHIEINDATETITWGLMTCADVEPLEGGAILRQDGKELHMSILSPESLEISLISLDPPPLEIDKTIKSFKRIEIRVPAYTAVDNKISIKVRLEGK